MRAMEIEYDEDEEGGTPDSSSDSSSPATRGGYASVEDEDPESEFHMPQVEDCEVPVSVPRSPQDFINPSSLSTHPRSLVDLSAGDPQGVDYSKRPTPRVVDDRDEKSAEHTSSHPSVGETEALPPHTGIRRIDVALTDLNQQIVVTDQPRSRRKSVKKELRFETTVKPIKRPLSVDDTSLLNNPNQNNDEKSEVCRKRKSYSHQERVLRSVVKKLFKLYGSSSASVETEGSWDSEETEEDVSWSSASSLDDEESRLIRYFEETDFMSQVSSRATSAKFLRHDPDAYMRQGGWLRKILDIKPFPDFAILRAFRSSANLRKKESVTRLRMMKRIEEIFEEERERQLELERRPLMYQHMRRQRKVDRNDGDFNLLEDPDYIRKMIAAKNPHGNKDEGRKSGPPIPGHNIHSNKAETRRFAYSREFERARRENDVKLPSVRLPSAKLRTRPLTVPVWDLEVIENKQSDLMNIRKMAQNPSAALGRQSSLLGSGLDDGKGDYLFGGAGGLRGSTRLGRCHTKQMSYERCHTKQGQI